MDDLKYIKKHYSESLSHICRSLFPTLLETEGLLTQLLEKKFDHSSSLGDDLKDSQAQEQFKDFIYSLVDVEKPTPEIIGAKDAFKLMEDAGYILFPECKTEEDIQSYRHYFYREGPTPVYKKGESPEYRSGEELCTFNGGRLDSCRVWFAVKQNVDEIKREDFKNPQREDEYGTSVISIQFSKGERPTLSIKNRYNHTVNHPDATFSNNLENIIPGLTRAFAETFSLNLKTENLITFNIKGYRQAEDGKFYRENCEENNIVYCKNNVIIDNGAVTKLSSDYMLLDDYIFDLKHLRVITYETYKQEQESGKIIENNDEENAFISSLGKIKNFEMTKGENKERIMTIKTQYNKDVTITFGKDNRILEVEDPNVKVLRDNYLSNSKSIRSFSAPNTEFIYNNVLKNSQFIQHLNVPNVRAIGNYFLHNGSLIKELDMPNLKEIGNHCFNFLIAQNINVPELEKIGNDCFSPIESLNEIKGELFDYISDENQENLFYANPTHYIKTIDSANPFFLEIIKNISKDGLQTFSAPNLKEIGYDCFCEDCFKIFNAPNLAKIGSGCFCGDGFNALQEFNAPNLTIIGKESFLGYYHPINFNCGVEFKQEIEELQLTPQQQKLLNDCGLAVENLQCELLGKEPAYQITNPEQNNGLDTQNTSENVLEDWKNYKKIESQAEENDTVEANTPNE